MLDHLNAFSADEDGAVTVDWVVLTAAIIGLGIAVMVSIKSGARTMATSVKTSLSTNSVPVVAFN